MKRFLLMILAIVAFGSVSAQVTTAALNGKVVDEKGNSIVGATVIAVHTPSGTQYGVATNTDGRYNFQGMRTGGPYTVTISFVGYRSVELTDLVLRLGEALSRDVALDPSPMDLDAIVVIGNGSSRFDSNKTGAASNFSRAMIDALPTIDRSIFDVVRMMPQASLNKTGGISIAGSNNRYNTFQIDGAVSNDVFGLTPSGMNGGQTDTNVVALESIEEIQIVVAPFDVRQSGFTGGGINAITKSGTNSFKGAAYTYFNNQDFYGTTPGKNVENREKLSTQSTQVYGASIGGPIVRDKLFFFVNGEFSKDSYPSSFFPGSDAVSSYITKEEAQKIVDRYQELTGYTESFGKRNIIKQSIDIMARLDWNINKNNKLSLRYQFKDAYKEVDSSNPRTYLFNNSTYRFSDATHSLVGELNSRLDNNLSNELRAGYTRVRDSRGAPYQLPNVEIRGLGAGTTAYIGTEYSSGANTLAQDIYTLTDNLTWYTGTHTVTFGTHNEFYNMGNLFIQGNNGCYSYENIDRFLAGQAYQYSWNYSDQELTGTTRWESQLAAAQFGFYVQDEWKPNRNFSLTYGLRIDIPVLFDTPTENPEFNQSSFANNGQNTVGRTPTTNVLWSPRIGFRYHLTESHNTLLRGGVGIFTGRVPLVWISNTYGNTGMELKGVTLTAPQDPDTKKYDYANSKVPDFSTTPVQVEGRAANPDICTVDKNFRYPQVLRANLALEQRVAGGWKFTIEGLYTKTLNNVFFENLAAKDNGKKVYAVSEQDANENNTCTYYDYNSENYKSVMNLKNTNKGYTYNLSAMVEKHFAFGLDLMASYAFGHSYTVNDGTSSVASSNWKYNYAVNSNDPNELAFSLFDIPHRVTASATYTSPRYARGRLQTIISLVYQGYSGQRYAQTMNEGVDFNGDRQFGNSMLYIPTEVEIDRMQWTANGDITADQAKALFADWCATDTYAKNHRGQWAERYGAVAPFEHHFNLHIAQSFIYNRKTDGRIQLSLDILNIGNLFNRNWGKYYSPVYNIQVLKVTQLTKSPDGNNVPTYTWNGSQVQIDDMLSRWHMQLGLRVTF